MRTALLSALLCLSGTVVAYGQTPTSYIGACDGSATVALDTNHFVVANDEENQLRIYRIGNAAPLPSIDLDSALKTDVSKKTGKPKEADIEGAARIGNRIYWIGSHSRDKGGDKEPSRHRFFATEIVPATGASPPSLKVIGVPYKDLLDDLLKTVEGNGLKEGAETAPEKPGGLNIEGLAATPDGHLLIGFRNPRPGGKAIVIPLLNPADVVDKKAKALFGKPELLSLEERGIRSIEWINGRYLIIAGPFNDGGPGIGGDFALYTWSGPGSDPKSLKKHTVDLNKLHPNEKLRPEAIFAMPALKEAYVLSDDDGVNGCKDLPQEQKRFRGQVIESLD